MLHLNRVSLELVHGLERRFAPFGDLFRLLGDHLGRFARLPREASHQRCLKLIDMALAHPERVNDDPILRQEFDEIRTAESRRILILPAASKAKIDALDFISEMRDIIAARAAGRAVSEGIDQRDHHR